MNQIEQILDTARDFDSPQVFGVCALIFIAHREQTSVRYQWKEWNFSDIPDSVIDAIDELDDDDQLTLVAEMTEAYVVNFNPIGLSINVTVAAKCDRQPKKNAEDIVRQGFSENIACN